MSNSPQAFGQVVHIGPTEQVSEKFRKRTIVLKTDTDTQYPQEVAFQLSQDRCDTIEKYGIKVGQSVTISYNLRGRRWDDPKTGIPKWFNTLDAWRIEAAQGQTQAEPTDIASQFPTEAPAESTDLPF
jgi:hypothetical protein